jgi:hypothetical protein
VTQSADAPTPKALADLVARCDQINRFETQLTAAEEMRIAALAAGILVMRQVLDLRPIDPDKLNFPPFWARTQESLPASAGFHRWIWDFRPTPMAQTGRGGGGGGFGRGGQLALPGKYRVRLTVGGKSYEQPLLVKRDPRSN